MLKTSFVDLKKDSSHLLVAIKDFFFLSLPKSPNFSSDNQRLCPVGPYLPYFYIQMSLLNIVGLVLVLNIAEILLAGR
jgi:hypothetical protein